MEKKSSWWSKRGFRLKNSLFLRVYANYAVLLLLFTIILGGIFVQLYRTNSTDSYRSQIRRQAQSIAKRYREFIITENYEEALPYLEIVMELENSEVWTISNPNAETPMPVRMTSVDLSGAVLESEQEEVIAGAFENKSLEQMYFSNIHGHTMLTIGVPILNAKNEVCGAVLIHTPMQGLDRGVSNILSMILISALVALVISFVIAFALVKQITIPFSKMRSVALRLVNGNYRIKTGIERKDEIGDLAHTIDVLSDRLQENEDKRESMEQMRRDFFANVSHELRTPITVIRAYAESLVDDMVPDEAKKRQYFERMLMECKSMERLVGDLLVLSKMQNPDFEIEKEPVNLVQVFDDITRSANKIGEQKRVEIRMLRERDCYMVSGDYDRLRQMFLVILDNAVKFSPENAIVTVTLSGNERIEVSIRDEGIGISEQELPYIFDKFYKSKLRENAQGSGLGLAIARQIALKHDGAVRVLSVLGKGTEFIFTFIGLKSEEMEN